jgi:hypothetical protein
MRIPRSSAPVLATVVAALLMTALGPSAATFTSTPPPRITAPTGPLTWTFESDGSGTPWDHVTWKVSTEPEWQMCGGPSGTVTLEGLAPGTYWVEIADEIDLAYAGESLELPPFDRCSEPHSPALGPLHPVTLSSTVVAQPTPAELESTAAPTPAATATTTVLVSPGPKSTEAAARCPARYPKWRKTRAAIRADHRRLLDSVTAAERTRSRRRLALDRSTLRELHRPCQT